MEEPKPGFRFYPTEEELIGFYLRHQLDGTRRDLQRVIPVVSIFDMEPWDLPNLAGELCKGDTEQWFFFVPRQEREARGGRPTRTTSSGYWKATGSPGKVFSSSDNKVIGMKKTMVFYIGKAPHGKKTKYKLNEYRATDGAFDPSPGTIPKFRHEFTLCRMYVISGSFRAFDRRPLEVVDQPVQGSVGTSVGALEGGSTSAEVAEGGLDVGAAGDTDDSALWDWEQLNWL